MDGIMTVVRCEEWEGNFQDMKRGIPRGASLSPLLGAFYLLDLDKRMEGLGVKYFRYMDDILILAPGGWKLKKAIRVLNETFNELKWRNTPTRPLWVVSRRASISSGITSVGKDCPSHKRPLTT